MVQLEDVQRNLISKTSTIEKHSLLAPIFRRHVRPKRDGPDLFTTKLPPELRNRIYELVLIQGPEVEKRPTRPRWKEPPLLRTCKLIRSEGMSIFYGLNTFKIKIVPDYVGFSRLVKRMERIIAACGPRPFTKLEFELVESGLRFLPHMLPLLELMRASGFEPSETVYQPEEVQTTHHMKLMPTSSTSIFRMTGKTKGMEQYLPEKALSLARRAREEGWTAHRLALRFSNFVTQQKARKGRVTTIYVEGKPL